MRKKFVVAVDVGGTNIKIAVLTLDGYILRKKIIPTSEVSEKKLLLRTLIALITSILYQLKIKKKDVIGIGIGVPGLIDSNHGVIHNLVNIKGFKEVRLKAIFEKKLNIPTYLDNDVNVMSLGELYYGSAKGAHNVICITLGTGIGGGVILNGHLYRGSSLSAGEIGHTTINENGPVCNCGNKGCLEVYVGNKAIVQLAFRKYKKYKKGIIYNLIKDGSKRLTPKIISDAARNGDILAKDVLKETGARIGIGLANAINFINPDRIVIGGGISQAGKILFDSIRLSIKNRAMKLPGKTAKIVKAKLGNDAALFGALALITKDIKCIK